MIIKHLVGLLIKDRAGDTDAVACMISPWLKSDIGPSFFRVVLTILSRIVHSHPF